MKVEVTGTKVVQVAVDEVRVTQLDDGARALFIESGGYNGIINVSDGATILTDGGGLFTITADNASTINVYVVSNKVVIQNKTAAAIDVDYKWI